MQPCDQCPFTRKPDAVRLDADRVEEICGSFLTEPGSMFPCHKTVEVDDDCEDDDERARWSDRPGWQMCAGGLILAEKLLPENPVSMLQLAERFGLYDRTQLRGHDTVFDSVDEMLATALTRRRKKR